MVTTIPTAATEISALLSSSICPSLSSSFIIERLNEIGQVRNIHDLHILSLDEAYNVLTAHVALTEAVPITGLVELKSKIRDALKEEGIQHATLEFEMPDEACAFEDCI